MAEQKIALPRASTPEEVGISSAWVADFMNKIEERRVNLHSFMIVRNGQVAAECYRFPFTKDRPHAMYSVSKTFTATAVGIAAAEGLLSLDDKVVSFFPELSLPADPRLEQMTVRHLLNMTAGKDVNVLSDKSKGKWAECFFNSPWFNEPGKEFRYISENTYMLSAIVNRAAGMCMRDFLEPRLFKPLGIDYPFWETDENGIEAGGWGLYCKTEDIAKLMLCYLQKGTFNGRQVIPEEFAEAAPRMQTDNSASSSASDSAAGYGYGIWRSARKDTYRADGMFSQFSIVLEDKNAVMAVTAGIPLEQEALDFLFEDLERMFLENADEETLPVTGLYDRLAAAAIETPSPATSSPLQLTVEGRNIHFRKKIFLNLIGFPMSMLPLAVTFMANDRAGNIDDVCFHFDEASLTISWREGDEANTVRAGMNGRFCYGEMTLGGVDFHVSATAEWRADDRLYIQIRPLETIGKRMLEFRFRTGDRVVMTPSSDPDTHEITRFLRQCLFDAFKNPVIQRVGALALKALPGIVEPKHYGHFC
ncbi:MAG: serine hydrolase [Clostridia bacterium]|nr:serine hydrolase [Clostridia bacterium]